MSNCYGTDTKGRMVPNSVLHSTGATPAGEYNVEQAMPRR